MNSWMCRAARGGRLYDEFRSRGIVAVGWKAAGSLDGLRTRDEFYEKVRQTWPEERDGSVAMSAGQLYRFVHEFQLGDRVVTYNSETRYYLIGVITGSYRYDPDFEMPNVHAVRWNGEVERDRLSVAARNSLGSSLTIFSISEEVASELEAALKGESPKAAPAVAEGEPSDQKALLDDIQARAVEFIKDKIQSLDWDELQELVAGLLRAMGYKTRVSPEGADRGKDIIASPDGFGFENPRIVVEVKHRNGAIGSQQLRSFLGGRHQNDRGLYVSTGGFTKDAQYEADRAAIPISLMSIDDLVGAIVEHYENLDPTTKQLLPLKRVYWPT